MEDFFTGKYSINAKKKIEDTLLTGESNGKLEFNTEVTDKNNKVVAIQNFDQSSFKTNLKNGEALDNNSKRIVVDGKEFVTNDVKVSKNKYQSPQEINLSFNQDLIDKFKKERKETEDKAKKFMADYTKNLNKAYKKSDYKYIEDYIEEDTKVAKYMKKVMESKAKNKYSNPQLMILVKIKTSYKLF